MNLRQKFKRFGSGRMGDMLEGWVPIICLFISLFILLELEVRFEIILTLFLLVFGGIFLVRYMIDHHELTHHQEQEEEPAR